AAGGRRGPGAGDARPEGRPRGGTGGRGGEDGAGGGAFSPRLIETAPTFAEGWNKRATVRYMAENSPASIADCRETLARNPHHFGALSGQGLCHLMLGQFDEAALLFRRTLAVHPHLGSARNNLRTALSEIVKRN